MFILNTYKQKRRDLVIALLISLLLSLLLLVPVFTLDMARSAAHLSFIFLGLFVLGVGVFTVGTALGSRIPVVFQLAKFALVGGLSTALELALLNGLFLFFGRTDGLWFSFFKTVTFCVALLNSYIFNKYWSFTASGANVPIEFTKFFISNMIGLLINVGVASFVVNVLPSPSALSQTLWANIGAMVAVFVTMVWNFLSYKFLVFKALS